MKNLAILITILSSRTAFSQVDPKIHWLKVDLPHFELIYDAQYQKLAEEYAEALESSYQTLRPLYPSAPEKTVVVLNDNSDQTNGFATVLPYPMIQSFPVLPANNDSIGAYGNWSKELLLHEYTHILAMYQRRDTFTFLSHIFGSLMSPNIFLPRWWHEGLAVEMETRYSEDGRLRSAQQDSWLRESYLSGETSKITVAQANEVSIPSWPYGARPYLYGSSFWSHSLDQKEPNLVGNLANAHGGRFPYFLSAPAETWLGSNYEVMFSRSLEDVSARVQKQLTSLRFNEKTVTDSLNLGELESLSPSISPNGLMLAYISKDKTLRRSLQILERPSTSIPFNKSQIKESLQSATTENENETHTPLPHLEMGEAHELLPDHAQLRVGIEESEDGPLSGSISRLNWSADSNFIAYDKVELVNRYYTGSDLYIFNVEAAKSKRVSHHLRAREPSFSPDQQKLVFVQLEPGLTNIAVLDINTQTSQVMIAGRPQERFSNPVFRSEKEIVFTRRWRGEEQLFVFNTDTHKETRVLASFPEIRVSECKNGELLFMSPLNGVPNLYVTKDLIHAFPVTHVETAVTEGTRDFVNKDLYVSELTETGVQVARLPAEFQWQGHALPVVKPLYSDRYATAKVKGMHYDVTVDNEAELKTQLQNPQEYSAGSYLLPRYWFPYYYWDSYSSYLSASTSAQDPLGKHAYNAYLNYDLSYGRLGYDVSYINNSTSVQIVTQMLDQTYELPGYNPERTQYSHIEGDIEYESISPYLFGTFGWSTLGRSLPGYSTQQTGPSFGFYDTEYKMSGAQVSPEDGWGGSAQLTAFLNFGGYTVYNQLELAYVKYLSSFLPKRHAIMLKFQSFLTDRTVPTTNYASTLSIPSHANTVFPQYLMRGYPTGEFLGRIVNNATLEYRFPIAETNTGAGMTPLFFRRFQGHFVADGIELDGLAYDNINGVYRTAKMANSYWDVGMEVQADTTVGYFLPLSIFAGVYWPLELTLSSAANIAVGIYL